MTPDQEKKLNELHTAIVGNEALGTKGIIPRIIDLEIHKEEDKKLKNRIAGAVIIGVPIFSAIWAFIIEFWNKLVH